MLLEYAGLGKHASINITLLYNLASSKQRQLYFVSHRVVALLYLRATRHFLLIPL